MFGTDDLIYVPEGGKLSLYDVYWWRRLELDVRRAGLRMKASAFDFLSGRMRGTLEIVRESERLRDMAPKVEENVNTMVRDLAARSGALAGIDPGNFSTECRNPSAKMWVTLSDLPAETFHGDDYERSADCDGVFTPFHTYGNVKVAQLDSLEVAISGEEEEVGELPFSIDFPGKDGITLTAPSPLEPLPLVEEFCGVHGASSRGNTVNIDTHGKIPDYHQFCTPLGTLGNHLYCTLYFYLAFSPQARVAGPIRPERLQNFPELMERSGFQVASQGSKHQIFQRNGDVIHLYRDLDGKETEGVPTMQPLLVVACAGGLFDPMQRSELFDAILESLR